MIGLLHLQGEPLVRLLHLQEERIGGLLHLQEERLVGPLHPQLALQALEVNTCSRPPTLHIAPVSLFVYNTYIEVR